METLGLIASLSVAVAFGVALFIFVRKCIKDKNWSKLVDLVLAIVTEAEDKYESGADKLEYATALTLKTAEEIGFKISKEEVTALIENIIKVTKKVNIK